MSVSAGKTSGFRSVAAGANQLDAALGISCAARCAGECMGKPRASATSPDSHVMLSDEIIVDKRQNNITKAPKAHSPTM